MPVKLAHRLSRGKSEMEREREREGNLNPMYPIQSQHNEGMSLSNIESEVLRRLQLILTLKSRGSDRSSRERERESEDSL